ncbi:MAG: hypothetical protein M3O00_11685 [Pseudomonadota bacterium]|nr:hypothetical protein [Pseudomonadota bacterium]
MGTLDDGPGHTLAEALVALAVRQGLDGAVDWADVDAIIEALLKAPQSPQDLRFVLTRTNEPALALVLQDWLSRAVSLRERSARDAARAGEKVMAPLQNVSLGVLATSGLGLAAGTLMVEIGIPILGAAAVASGAAFYGRWRLSRREDNARSAAEAIGYLVEVAREAVE